MQQPYMETTITTLFEDEHLLIIHKPSGIAVQHQDKSNNLGGQINMSYQAVHRLDQRVSGLLMLAKTPKIFNELSKAFQERKITKKYKAVVAQTPKLASAELIHFLRKNSHQKKSEVFQNQVAHSKEAKLRYQIIEQSNRYCLLEVELITGLFHQIRAQLAKIGSPIVGDQKYGYPRSSPDGSIFLQAHSLSFRHPIQDQEMQFEIEMPALWGKFGFGPPLILPDTPPEG